MATENAKAVEAILMVAEQPVEPQLLAQLLEINLTEVEALLAELMASYEVEDRGFILTKVAGGYRYQSHPDQAPYVERFVLEGQTARLSAAALETLAIIAYKQPLSRAQVGAIRGVNVDGVIRTLEQRGYIAEVARDPGPGNPILFGTTDVFLEKLGINSVDDLPPIAAFVPGPDVVEQLEHGLRAEIDLRIDADLAEGSADAEPDVAPGAAGEPGPAPAEARGSELADQGSPADPPETIVEPDAGDRAGAGDPVVVAETVDVVETDEGVVVTTTTDSIQVVTHDEPGVTETVETIEVVEVVETTDGYVATDTVTRIDTVTGPDGVDVVETVETTELVGTVPDRDPAADGTSTDDDGADGDAPADPASGTGRDPAPGP